VTVADVALETSLSSFIDHRSVRISAGGTTLAADLSVPDTEVIALNEQAKTRMRASVSLEIVPSASHLFEEPGTLDLVAARAGEWFVAHLAPAPRA
jgi:hypothetical protein